MLDISKFPTVISVVSCYVKATDWLHRRKTVTKNTRAMRDEFYRAMWEKSAQLAGIGFRALDPPWVEFILADGTSLRVKNNYTTLDDRSTLELAGNKPKVSSILKQNSIPVPDYVQFDIRSIGRAQEFLAHSDVPCVIKPAFGTGAGQGITTHVQHARELGWACARALRFDSTLLIEKQIPGDNFRLLFCEGKLLDIVRRNPPSVVGNGRSTIKTLIEQENRRRTGSWNHAQTLLRINQEMMHNLAAQSLTINSVPSEGEVVRLTTVINDNAASENVPATGEFCSATIETCRRAAELLGVNLAGVDVITPDPGQPLEDMQGVVLEVNTTPGLYVHKRGKDCPVALEILNSMINQHASQKPLSPSAEMGLQ